jgi:hypothetical protein
MDDGRLPAQTNKANMTADGSPGSPMWRQAYTFSTAYKVRSQGWIVGQDTCSRPLRCAGVGHHRRQPGARGKPPAIGPGADDGVRRAPHRAAPAQPVPRRVRNAPRRCRKLRRLRTGLSVLVMQLWRRTSLPDCALPRTAAFVHKLLVTVQPHAPADRAIRPGRITRPLPPALRPRPHPPAPTPTHTARATRSSSIVATLGADPKSVKRRQFGQARHALAVPLLARCEPRHLLDSLGLALGLACDLALRLGARLGVHLHERRKLRECV